MSIITDLTRMWLTRSAKPFLFQNEYDQQLPFSQCEGLGLYVHIPFCRELCGFCPYCKVQYDRLQLPVYSVCLLRQLAHRLRQIALNHNGLDRLRCLLRRAARLIQPFQFLHRFPLLDGVFS